VDLSDDRGAFAGFLLALLGAEVIAVEAADRPDSLVRAAYGRGKRSVDVAADDGLLVELVAGADVVLETGLPTGWDGARLAALNPALVHVTMSPFGSTGPKADWPASDLVIWAASGAMANAGDADRAPVRPSVPQAWCHAGAAAVAGALAALAERARSGQGQHVDVSAQRACTLATQSGLLAPRLGAPIPRRTKGGLTIGNVAYRSLYPAADGYVTITHVFGAVVGPFTQRLMQWVHDEGLCDAEVVARDWVNYERLLNEGDEPLERWEEAKAAVEALTSSKTKAELLAGAIERRLVVAPISTVSDVLANPQLEARGYWDDVDGVRHPGMFVRGGPVRARRLAAAVAPGADTAALRAESGSALGAARPGRRPAVPVDAG
jgi:crotonobetainyl-CoA:carnitine CoA-transferase CaiB-like acyl-CoA transferase